MTEGDEPGGFAWIVPHDHALRRARALFVFGAAITALYLIVPLLTAVLVLRVGKEGPWRRIDSLVRAFSPLGVAGLVVVTFVVVTALVVAVAWRGLPRRIVRMTGAREPTPEEARFAARGLEPFALARGMRAPTVWVIDDEALNALSFGRPEAAQVCFTRGAFTLPHDEFAALCAHELTSLTCMPFVYCTAAIDAVLFAEWCTRLLWTSAVLLFLTPIIGASPQFVAIAVLCIAALVGVTRLALVVADRALPPLLDDVSQLVDLDAVRLTALPAPFARLIARLLDDDRRVQTRWQVAHLWFERDSTEISPLRKKNTFFANLAPDFVPDLARRFERVPTRGLRDRARRARGQANNVVAPPS